MHALKRIAMLFLLLLVAPLALIGWFVTQPSLAKNKPSAAVADPIQLRNHVTTLATTFYPRSFLHRPNLRRTADYIRDQFRASGAQLTNQLYDVQGRICENVIAVFPAPRAGTIVVGAHYDACADTPGADDNASGVAGLIALAQLLGETRLNHTVELVAFCTEEPPFFGTPDMGSARHARLLRETRCPVVAVIVLEMIGYFRNEPRSQTYPAVLFRIFYPSTGNFIAVIGNTRQRALLRAVKRAMHGATELPVYSASVPAFIPGVDFSDHRSYWAEGFPAVMITDTSFLRNPRYHQLGDLPDQLDYTNMARTVVGVYEAVKQLDQ